MKASGGGGDRRNRGVVDGDVGYQPHPESECGRAASATVGGARGVTASRRCGRCRWATSVRWKGQAPPLEPTVRARLRRKRRRSGAISPPSRRSSTRHDPRRIPSPTPRPPPRQNKSRLILTLEGKRPRPLQRGASVQRRNADRGRDRFALSRFGPREEHRKCSTGGKSAHARRNVSHDEAGLERTDVARRTPRRTGRLEVVLRLIRRGSEPDECPERRDRDAAQHVGQDRHRPRAHRRRGRLRASASEVQRGRGCGLRRSPCRTDHLASGARRDDNPLFDRGSARPLEDEGVQPRVDLDRLAVELLRECRPVHRHGDFKDAVVAELRLEHDGRDALDHLVQPRGAVALDDAWAHGGRALPERSPRAEQVVALAVLLSADVRVHALLPPIRRRLRPGVEAHGKRQGPSGHGNQFDDGPGAATGVHAIPPQPRRRLSQILPVTKNTARYLARQRSILALGRFCPFVSLDFSQCVRDTSPWLRSLTHTSGSWHQRRGTRSRLTGGVYFDPFLEARLEKTSGHEVAPDDLRKKYHVIAKLGEGGMALVHLAVVGGVAGVRKLAVLKSIRPQLVTDPQVREMFLAEARLAATLNHPNIVQTFEVVVLRGRPVIVMEYMHAQPLSRILRDGRRAQVPLSLQLLVIRETLTGLEHGHKP